MPFLFFCMFSICKHIKENGNLENINDFHIYQK